jgi:hypothetical protein
MDLIRYVLKKTGASAAVPTTALLQSEYFSTFPAAASVAAKEKEIPPRLLSHRELNSQCLSLTSSIARLVEIRDGLAEEPSKKRVQEYVATLAAELSRLLREADQLRRRQEELNRKFALVKVSLFGEPEGGAGAGTEAEDDLDILDLFSFLKKINATLTAWAGLP